MVMMSEESFSFALRADAPSFCPGPTTIQEQQPPQQQTGRNGNRRTTKKKSRKKQKKTDPRCRPNAAENQLNHRSNNKKKKNGRNKVRQNHNGSSNAVRDRCHSQDRGHPEEDVRPTSWTDDESFPSLLLSSKEQEIKDTQLGLTNNNPWCIQEEESLARMRNVVAKPMGDDSSTNKNNDNSTKSLFHPSLHRLTTKSRQQPDNSNFHDDESSTRKNVESLQSDEETYRRTEEEDESKTSVVATHLTNLHDENSNNNNNDKTTRLRSDRITRLRLKWWNAMAQARRKKDFYMRLKEELALLFPVPTPSSPSCIDVLDTDTTATGSAGSNGKLSVGGDIDDAKDYSEQSKTHLEEASLPCRLDGSDGDLDERTAFDDDVLVAIFEERQTDNLREVMTLLQKKANITESRPYEASMKYIESTDSILDRIIQLAIDFDYPDYLRMALQASSHSWRGYGPSKIAGRARTRSKENTPVICAARLGHDECLSILLARNDDSASDLKMIDLQGDNVFHQCCRADSLISTLNMLLKYVMGQKNYRQLLSKLLTAKNEVLQTPFHVACANGNVEIVELFLKTCTSALMTKIQFMEDKQGYTPLCVAILNDAIDVVVCLVMWRGNHMAPVRGAEHEDDLSKNYVPSALLCASRLGKVAMIDVLVQFSDLSDLHHGATAALSGLLKCTYATRHDKVEGVQMLMNNGGDPFVDLNAGCGSQRTTALLVASQHSDPYVLRQVLILGQQELATRQEQRRKDPKLQHQPESFFVGIESNELFLVREALSHALVECLFSSWHDSLLASLKLSSAVVLLDEGATLGATHRAHLLHSMQSKRMRWDITASPETSRKNITTSFRQRVYSTDINAHGLVSNRSMLLLNIQHVRMSMIENGPTCPFLHTRLHDWSTKYESCLPQSDISLMSDDGVVFHAHKSVLFERSAKLDAAVRFASLSQQRSEEVAIPNVVQMGLPSQMCQFLLQHIYHDSISSGWSTDHIEFRRELLDVMLMAEEWLCETLIQECEMRLLSSCPTSCFCWSCSQLRSQGQKSSKCSYSIRGPSLLLTSPTTYPAESLLDVLSVVRHLLSTGVDYTTSLSSSMSSAPVKKTSSNPPRENESSSLFKGLEQLHATVVVNVLNNFTAVVRSETFKQSAAINQYDDDTGNATANSSTGLPLSHSALLLQSCLEDFSSLKAILIS